MAREPRAGKSETLTIRLDPKTRFILEFMSRLKGQTITTVVERAIVKAADQESVRNREGYPQTWQDFWDISEGVRALKMAEHSEFFPTYEEERRLAFCKDHWPFFWASPSRLKFLNHYVDVLWPRIDEFVQMHEDQKASDYFAAGKAMQHALQNARLKPPEWPQPKPSPNQKPSKDLDDEIPF